MYFIRRKCTGPVFTKILILSLILRILSKEFFLDLSVILRKILRIFVNTGPGLCMCIDFLPTHHPANQKTDTGPSTTATHTQFYRPTTLVRPPFRKSGFYNEPKLRGKGYGVGVLINVGEKRGWWGGLYFHLAGNGAFVRGLCQEILCPFPRVPTNLSLIFIIKRSF